MAKMIPMFGPAETDSVNEPQIYAALKRELSDDFTVIHSLPWLCAATKELSDPFNAPTGEIDFLILHPSLGILAIEVKGGKYRIDGTAFVHIGLQKRVNALNQSRRNTHGIAKWMAGKNVIKWRIGYALLFPNSAFPTDALPPGLVDPVHQARILLDLDDLPRLGTTVVEVMSYWKAALANGDLGEQALKEVIEALCPEFDGTPQWGLRVQYDNHFWLRLTPEQISIANGLMRSQRSVVTGWPGTGKTLIGIEIARRLAKEGQKVLVLTYNALLCDYIDTQLKGTGCTVFTWHKLCRHARAQLGLEQPKREWFSEGCLDDLRQAINCGFLSTFDTLVLDEGQALRPIWCEYLVSWFLGKRIIAFCDETQVFSFEREPTSLSTLSGLLGGIIPFYLTIVMRMPRAVTDRLKEALPSQFQLSSPRAYDPDTVRECVVEDWGVCLTTLTEDLTSQGVELSDVVVLTKYGFAHEEVAEFLETHPNIRVEMVSRFRGMEGAIVIIVEAEDLSDAELFCAYSRATTKCIALFSTGRLPEEARGRFLPAVMHNQDNLRAIEAYRLRTSTKALLVLHDKRQVDEFKYIELFWSRTWKCWMMEFDRRSPMSFWIDYLIAEHPWPVVFWDRQSRGTAYLTAGKDKFRIPLRLKHCAVCNDLTPHLLMPTRCAICEKEVGANQTVLMQKDARALVEYYDQVSLAINANSRAELDVYCRKLPLALAIGALGVYARAHAFSEDPVTGISVEGGSSLYRMAFVIVHSWIMLSSDGDRLDLTELAEETNHPELAASGIDIKKWRSTLALGTNLFLKKQYLQKVRNGSYVRCGVNNT